MTSPTSKALLKKVGLEDTDGDGYRQLDVRSAEGQNLEISFTYGSHPAYALLADTMIGMMSEIGIKLIAQPTQGSAQEDIWDSCKWEAMLWRGDGSSRSRSPSCTISRRSRRRAPQWHQGTGDKAQELLPFEQQLIEILNKVRTEPDTAKRAELLNEYNHVFTENVYNVGLVTIPAALIVNKRFKDVPAGAPVLAYQWSEDNTLRERMWIAKEDQSQVPELMPGILPGVN